MRGYPKQINILFLRGTEQIEKLKVFSTEKNPCRDCFRSNQMSPVQGGFRKKIKVSNTGERLVKVKSQVLRNICKNARPQYMGKLVKTYISTAGNS